MKILPNLPRRNRSGKSTCLSLMPKQVPCLACRLIRFPGAKGMILPEQGNAPDASQPNDGINDPADQCALSTKNPGHQVKLKDPHQRPVQRADDRQHQCGKIHTTSS